MAAKTNGTASKQVRTGRLNQRKRKGRGKGITPEGRQRLREVKYEESYYAQYGPNARTEDPCLMIIPCKWGHLYPAGPETLAASVDGYPRVAARLKRLKCCRVHQDGDFGELTVLFDVANFDKVAKIMRPHRKRRWTEEQKRQARERLAKYQYTPVVDGRFSEHTGVPAAGAV